MKFLLICVSIISSILWVNANVPNVRLASGYDMPIVGFGSAKIFNPDKILSAFEIGYRHINTALLYKNEKVIGAALKKWFAMGNKREDIFITTKLPPYGNRPEDVEWCVNESLKNLGVDYIDMYLVHHPWTFLRKQDRMEPDLDKNGDIKLDMTTDHLAVWKAMEKQVKAGKLRSIGLSNFNETQILKIIRNSEIRPSNLEIEIHEYLQQKPIREFCAEHNISVTAYAPLGSTALRPGFNPNLTEESFPDLFKHPVIHKIGLKYGKSNSQVMLRHLIQEGIIVIPKSQSPKRQLENFDIFDFELSDEDVEKLRSLDRGIDARIYIFIEEYKNVNTHPEFPFPEEIPPTSLLLN